jgi:hypothetical protein
MCCAVEIEEFRVSGPKRYDRQFPLQTELLNCEGVTCHTLMSSEADIADLYSTVRRLSVFEGMDGNPPRCVWFTCASQCH